MPALSAPDIGLSRWQTNVCQCDLAAPGGCQLGAADRRRLDGNCHEFSGRGASPDGYPAIAALRQYRYHPPPNCEEYL